MSEMFDDPFYISATALESYFRVAAEHPTRLQGYRFVVYHRLRTACERLRAMPKPRLPE